MLKIKKDMNRDMSTYMFMDGTLASINIFLHGPEADIVAPLHDRYKVLHLLTNELLLIE